MLVGLLALMQEISVTMVPVSVDEKLETTFSAQTFPREIKYNIMLMQVSQRTYPQNYFSLIYENMLILKENIRCQYRILKLRRDRIYQKVTHYQ